ncbi:hypothetical protein EUGRSUZ_C03939 [Eucalyptus grandis]|uniref:Uncharacterized protein n=1 Tax=Eucalyptus grandis TaxID=71139 RepID=A0ACC3LIR9_EUCGR|nr:hypothetical protein EUGRSUZ_C03939 [Eucalyptus grandis]
MEPTVKVVSQGPSGLLQSDEYTIVYPREAEILKELRDAIANHPQSYSATAPDGGQFIALPLKLLNAKKTIEVGVFTGYSPLLTGLRSRKMARPTLNTRSTSSNHKLCPVLDNLLGKRECNFSSKQENESSFNFAFVNAYGANLKNYHERLLRLVRARGVIMYDNTLWGSTVTLSGPSSVDLTRVFAWKDTIKFNKMMVGNPRVDIPQVPLGDDG